jgi:carboxyl-terminal processing protease
VVSPLPDTPAFREGILAGDKIVAIEGESTKGMDITDAVHRLRGEVGTRVSITIFRPSDQSTVEHTIERGIIRIPNIYVYTIDDHIGYIRLLEFKQTASSDLNKALNLLEEQHVDGLILDLRFNSGGLLDMAWRSAISFCRRICGLFRSGAEIRWMKKSFFSTKAPQSRLPLVLLVNQASASASEIVAGAMQDHGRAIVVGPKDQRTFGKGSVQTVIPLSNDAALKLTTAKYFTPWAARSRTTRDLEPDIKVDIDEKFQRDLIMLNRLAKTARIDKRR